MMQTVDDIQVGDEVAGHILIDDTNWTGAAPVDFGDVPFDRRPFRFRRIADEAQFGFVMERSAPISEVADMLDYVRSQRPVQTIAP
jgi:hypothetical protein